jgi:2-oxoglutarate ferredoxin oxidoreductase subunit delta
VGTVTERDDEMIHIVFFEDICKGCSLCTSVCPEGIVSINKNRINASGYNPAGVTDEAKCTGCAFCARICPDIAIRIEKVS